MIGERLQHWQQLSLNDRIQYIRRFLPPLLVVWVVVYQLGLAQTLEAAYGHAVHYGVEIAFYSLVGPTVTWLTLIWVERKLKEKELLERQVQAIQAEKTAVLAEERARIARDLHDGVAQTLYFLALKTDGLRSQLMGEEAIVKELREIGRSARQVIREVRRTIFALQPLDWPAGGFTTALRKFVTGFAEQAGWQVSVEIDPGLAISPALEPALFRLVQESLNNIAKHATAKNVWVKCEMSADHRWLELTVRDDGQGFSVQTQTNRGYGLSQMEKRAARVGGTLKIESQPDQGTRVFARLPLEGAKA